MSKRRRHRTMTQTDPVSNAPMPYFSLARHPDDQSADIYIFGNIAQNRGDLSGLLQANSDQSSYDLANQIAGIPEDWAITVHINSNGGELKEGLGIHNIVELQIAIGVNHQTREVGACSALKVEHRGCAHRSLHLGLHGVGNHLCRRAERGDDGQC